MAPQRTWTFPMLRRAKARIEAGESWADVAQDMDVNMSTLRKQVYVHLGKIDRSNCPKRFKREAMLVEAIRLRNTEKMSYGMIKDAVGWPRTTCALQQSIRRYAAYHELEVFKGLPTKRRSRWDDYEK